MKIVLFSIIVALTTLLSFGQNTGEHLTFKGIPIDGPLDSFVTKIKTAGFTYLGTQVLTACFKGDFAGYRGCGIYAHTYKDVVSFVSVIFPKCDDWFTLERDYEILKKMLIKKYGEPSKSVEEFLGSTKPTDNSDKLLCLLMGECNYETLFEVSNGYISLKMANIEGLCGIVLCYFDQINTQTLKSQAIDDL